MYLREYSNEKEFSWPAIIPVLSQKSHYLLEMGWERKNAFQMGALASVRARDGRCTSHPCADWPHHAGRSAVVLFLLVGKFFLVWLMAKSGLSRPLKLAIGFNFLVYGSASTEDSVLHWASGELSAYKIQSTVVKSQCLGLKHLLHH